MKRLYLRSGNQVTALAFPIKAIIEFLPSDTIAFGDIESKSIPSKTPTTRTKDAYTEQMIGDRVTGETVGVLREGKLETLNKLTNPIYDSTSGAATSLRSLVARAAHSASVKNRASQSKKSTRQTRSKLRNTKLQKVRHIPKGKQVKRKHRRGSASK